MARVGGLDPVTAFLEAGLCPVDWGGRAVILAAAGLLPRAKKPADAARDLFRRNPEFSRDLLAAGGGGGGTNNGVSSIRTIYGGNSVIRAGQKPIGGPRWTSYRYRRRGERKAHAIHVAGFHADPKAAAAAVFGELDVFEPITTPPRRVTPARTPAAVAVGAAAPAPSPPADPAVPPPAETEAMAAAIATTPPPTELVPMPAAAPPPADLPAPDVPVRLAAVIRAAGQDMRAWRSHLLTAQARRIDKDLAARGVRPELIRAFVAKAWLGPEAFTAAMRQAQQAAA